jgi:hypothetical protein
MKTNPLAFETGVLPKERITKALPTISTDHSAIHQGQAFALIDKMDIATTKVGAISIRPPTNVAATITIDMTAATSDLTYTAVDTGYAGNDITVTHADPSANNAPLSISVTGTAITISLATGVAGAITSTAALVKAAVNAHAEASLLVLCEDEGVGSGVVNAVAVTSLAGGTDASYVHFKTSSFSNSAGPMSISLIEDATFTGNTSTLTPMNRKRAGTVVSSLVPVTATVDATVVNGAGVLTLATILLSGSTTGAKVGATAMQSDEWLLAPGKNYLIAITNATSPAATVTLGYELFWYEESAY